jgi:hypothetical protein
MHELFFNFLVEQRLPWTDSTIVKRVTCARTGEAIESCWDIAVSITAQGDPPVQDLLVDALRRTRGNDLVISQHAFHVAQCYVPPELHSMVADFCTMVIV